MTPTSANTERHGVHAVATLIHRLGWMFREQHESDWGIDAIVEIVNDGVPTGRLVALQIKSGISWFRHATTDGWTFYGSKRHRLYWLEHDLPVLVVLYNTQTEDAYWAHVTENDAEPITSGFRLTVPRHQLLGAAAASKIQEVRRNWQPIRGDAWSRIRDAVSRCRADGIPVAPSAALWDAFAVSIPASKLQASEAVTFGLELGGEAPASSKTGRLDLRLPVRLTLEDLRGTWFARQRCDIFVCENPGVMNSAVEIGIRSKPLVVLGGYPGKAVEYLLLGLSFAGSSIHVHTDHDPTGKKIKSTIFGQIVDFEEWNPCNDRAHAPGSRAEELCIPDLIESLRITN